MFKGTCFLCFSKSQRIINIVKTHLQPVYEKLADLKIENDSHNLCFICHTRLQQSYQLSTLAKQNKSHLTNFLQCFDKFENKFGSCKSLVQLSKSLEVDISIPFNDVVNQELNLKEEDTDVAQPDTTEKMTEERIEIKIEKEYISENSQECDDNASKVFYGNESLHCTENNTHDTLLVEKPQDINDDEDKILKKHKNNKDRKVKRQKHYIDTKTVNGIVYYVCHYCPFVNKRKMNVVIHERSHTGDKPFSCDVCKRTFARKGNLNAHKNTHTGNKPHVCDVCQRPFAEISGLNRHKRVHTGEKPYSCDVCERRFADKTHLNSHKNIHTGTRPHVCDVCDQCFTDPGGLNRHKRIHTGEKPYTCDVCERKFSDKSHLNAHKYIHFEYKLFACDICGRKFSQSGSLRTHKRKHAGAKSFICDICNHNFTEKGHLTEHMNIHTGNKPYGCKFCDQKFAHSSSRNRHQRTHMADTPHTYCEVQLLPINMETDTGVNVKFITKL